MNFPAPSSFCAEISRQHDEPMVGTAVHAPVWFLLEYDAAWQTTHLGGHRFAPTLVTFPDGVSYGRVTSADIQDLLTSQQDGRLLLPHLWRGRVNFPPPAQAAEYFWRQETGWLALADLQLAGVDEITAEKWRVGLTAVPENELIEIDITSELFPVYASCGAVQPKTAVQFLRG